VDGSRVGPLRRVVAASADAQGNLLLRWLRNCSSYGHHPFKEIVMSNESKRAEGAAEELGGKLKKGVGKVIGNEQMQAEGIVKEKKGEAKQEAAKAAERTKGKVEEIAGAVKNRVGAVIDNEEMQAEGKATELAGEARQKANE
jgi:uncharacterized protein YjbJ (UPF0337 family)